jgi:hypothetical protein
MTWRMTVESELASLSIPQQYLSFSDAYLDSASRLCAVLKRSYRKSNYARGSVVLYLTFHAIELFLKGTILEKAPKQKVGNTHDIRVLHKRYKNLYPGKKYAFHAPFISGDDADLSALFSPEIIMELENSKQKNPWDQRHRYPRNREGQPWSGPVGFEPGSFLAEIKKLKADIESLKNLIFQAKAVSKGRTDKRRIPLT